MSDDPQADLIYAILAMDAYNRGYGTGINGLSDDVGTKLGDFSVLAHVNDDPNPSTNDYGMITRITGLRDYGDTLLNP